MKTSRRAPSPRWPPPLRDPLPLLLALAAPALAPLAGAALIAVAFAFWLSRRPPRREAVLVAPLLAAAALVLGAAGVVARLPPPPPDQWRAEAEERYRALWDEITSSAVAAARAVGAPPFDVGAGPAERLEVHRRLAAIAGAARATDLTLLLVDPDGQALAWEGRGLLHEPRPEELPRRGRDFRASFGAATLLAVEPLSDDPRPWRVVAGRSLRTGDLRLDLPRRSMAVGRRWAPLRDAAAARPDAVLISAPEAPTLAVERGAPQLPAWLARAPAIAWGALALALLGLATLRGVGLAVLWGTAVPTAHRPATVVALAAGGGLAAGLAAGAGLVALLALVASLAVVAVGWRLGDGPRRPLFAAAGGTFVALGLAGAALALQHPLGPFDLASLRLDAHALVLRLALLATVAGALVLVAGEAGAPPTGRLAPGPAGIRLAFGAALALLAAGAFHDRPWVAAPLLAAGGALAALWARGARWRRQPAALVPLTLLVALLGATAWEGGYRLALRHAMHERLAPGMAPPSAAELGALWDHVDSYFADFDLGRIVPRDPDGLQPGDLAYLLWRGSPLDRRNALSAVVVVPHGGAPVSFSYGLPLTDTGEVDSDPVRWGQIAPESWRELLRTAEVQLVDARGRWGVARLWLLPQPGFRLDPRPVEELVTGLLRGGPTERRPLPLPREVLFGLYAADGSALVSPWPETPALPAGLRSDRAVRVATPPGSAWAVAHADASGTSVLFLPLLDASAALERVGLGALALLLLAAAAALAGALLGLTRGSFRVMVGRAVRSYSKRLLLVYGGLLLLPLLALNLLLFRNLEERLLAEQRSSGEAAVRSAQQVLGEYVLSLEPGFGLGTALDDELLVWLSRVLQHEVNLYWGSNIDASSKRELFSAGLLPARIPGEIHARLVLLGHDRAWRRSRAAGTQYLELYAPLRIPGVGEGEPRLFLSLPLLAQQQELAGELAELRRRSLLLTAALFLLAAALGARLARTFTQPLQELVDGTRRIAAGATSLELAPSEQELAALVDAIDDMARRIAEGRQRLVREKQVVDRMVENITSGVVSLDRAGRVLLANRVAGGLLGTRVGESLRDRLAGEPSLAAVAAFLDGAGADPAESTVRLERGGEDREYRLAWVPVPGTGEPAALLVVEDATEVLRSQRLQAWAEMARIIAHEIKNPLTPIRLSTEHMVEVYQRDPERFDAVFARCSANILAQVDELQEIAQEFSIYSRLPRVELQPGDLAATVAEIVDSYRAAPPPGVSLRLEVEPAVVAARFDARLIRRAVRNLLENAVRASAGRGEVTVRVTRGDGQASLSVSDRGPGVPVDALPRIFDPYFSTHDTGTGLGLPITRRIVEEHGGSIQAQNRPGGGLEVVIRIPVE